MSGDRKEQRTSGPILRDGGRCVEEPRSAEGRHQSWCGQRQGKRGSDSEGVIRVPPSP